MDQAKFKLPRTRRAKVKAMERFPRPAMHCGGVWAHGYTFQMHACLPDVGKDSSTNIESMARVFDHILASTGQLPQHLWLQQDNAPNQCKNQCMFRWAIFLTMKGHHGKQTTFAIKYSTCM
jgi:hypothetical protein